MPTKIFRQLLHKTILKPNLLLNHNTLMVLLTKLPLPKLIKDFKILPTIKISPSTLLVNKLIVSPNPPKQPKQLNLNHLRPLLNLRNLRSLPNLRNLKPSLNPHKTNLNLLNLNLLSRNLPSLNHSSNPNSSSHHYLTNSSNHTSHNLLHQLHQPHQLHQLVQTILPASSPHQPHNNFKKEAYESTTTPKSSSA